MRSALSGAKMPIHVESTKIRCAPNRHRPITIAVGTQTVSGRRATPRPTRANSVAAQPVAAMSPLCSLCRRSPRLTVGDSRLSMAGKKVSEKTIATKTPTAVNTPNCQIGTMAHVRKERNPAAVVSEVKMTGCHISRMVTITASGEDVSGCSNSSS